MLRSGFDSLLGQNAMTDYFKKMTDYLNGVKSASLSALTYLWTTFRKDKIHLLVSLFLLAVAWLSLRSRWSGWAAVIVIYVDLVGLLFLAACRRHTLLPDRLTALFTLPITFFALILAFATIFLKCDCF